MASISNTRDSRRENEKENALAIMVCKNISIDKNQRFYSSLVFLIVINLDDIIKLYLKFRFLILMKQALFKINAYNSLIIQAEDYRKQKFSWDSKENIQSLSEVWLGLKNENLDFQISKRWQEIGFQVN